MVALEVVVFEVVVFEVAKLELFAIEIGVLKVSVLEVVARDTEELTAAVLLPFPKPGSGMMKIYSRPCDRDIFC